MKFISIGNLFVEMADIYAVRYITVPNPRYLVEIVEGKVVPKQYSEPETIGVASIYLRTLSNQAEPGNYIETRCTPEEFEIFATKISSRSAVPEVING